MKSFLQFIQESTATQQAARLGLEGDGHGGWYKDGEFVAKTEQGKLKFYNKRQRTPGQDPPQTEQEKNLSQGSYEQQPAAPPEEQAPVEGEIPPEQQEQPPLPVQSPDLAAGPPPVPKSRGTLTIGFGRFNPPTIGHGKLLAAAKKAAAGGDLKIYPSRSQDNKKNPLDVDMKVSYMRKMFPDFEENIVNDSEMRTVFDVLTTADEEGYSNVKIIVGADRLAEFKNLAQKYNGDLYDFEEIQVVSAGPRDSEKEGAEGMSASKLRKAAKEDDFKAFQRGIPSSLEKGEVTNL